jgi:hypothetical protein
MDLFGGKVVPFAEVKKRIESRVAGRPGMEDVPLMLTIPKHHTSFKKALVFDDTHSIDTELSVSCDESWIKKSEICAIACFGDLTIGGDLLCENEKFWPLMFVDGSLSCGNILKGGFPLIVGQDLNSSGYVIGEYNDGPLRVGGTLRALGYIPCCNDRKELRGHVIAGAVEATTFDARKDFSRNEIRAAAVPEVLSYKWFEIYKVLEMGRAGKSIWRTAADPYIPAVKLEAPPIPELKGVNLSSIGRIEESAAWKDRLVKLIETKIPLNPDAGTYPSHFSSYVGYQFDPYPKGKVLVLPAGTTVNGDIQLDWEAPWASKDDVIAVICEADLTVTGTIRNRTLEGGPLLFVGGDLKVGNLIKGGATVIILGNVEASGIVVGEYNDGVTRIAGDLTAQGFYLLDHDGDVGGKINARSNSDDDAEWRDVCVESVFLDEDETQPDADLLWAHQVAGRPIFL